MQTSYPPGQDTQPEIHMLWLPSFGFNFIEFPYLQLFCLTPAWCVSSVSHECSLLVDIPLMIFQQYVPPVLAPILLLPALE